MKVNRIQLFTTYMPRHGMLLTATVCLVNGEHDSTITSSVSSFKYLKQECEDIILAHLEAEGTLVPENHRDKLAEYCEENGIAFEHSTCPMTDPNKNLT